VAARPLILDAPPADARERLLEGLARAITDDGYAAATIADVVGHARVSKRTFYEHFADKEACYLALYAAASERMTRTIAEAAAIDAPWAQRMDAAAGAYFAELAAQPALTRTYLLEIQAAGPRALELRRTVHGRFAALLRALTEEAARDDASLRPLSPAMAIAVVGAVNELILLAVERDETPRLGELADTATELIAALVAAPARRDAG
jgi:AcrR family transcriptional regulator